MVDAPPADARDAWEALGAFLRRDLALMDGARREEALRTWDEITQAERTLDDRLAVGLVGGTGVGKSTLVNALAGQEISAIGDRRPTTDLVVAYRHSRTPLPENLPGEDISRTEVAHENDVLERVILLDFPDFDSVEELHHEVLRRYLPHLDVLLVLVDDVKYGDSRLFDLLREVSQSHENLHVILNKTDKLQMRYCGEWRRVAGEILDDLAGKLRDHAGVDVSRERMFSVSARNAFSSRSRARRGGGRPAPAGAGESMETGDFSRLVDCLESYRLEKRRRAAKELNIEARKDALCERLRSEVLKPESRERVRRAAGVASRRKAELADMLAGISPAVFRGEERRRLVSAALRREGAALGFPLDVFVALARLMRPSRSAAADADVELSGGRIERHYKAYMEGLENLLEDMEAEVEEDLPSFRPSLDALLSGKQGLPAWLSRAGEEFQRRLAAVREKRAARSPLWNHAFPAAVAALFLWSCFYPILKNALLRITGRGNGAQPGLLGEMLEALVSVLSPLFIVSACVCVVLAYAATALVSWARRVQGLEGAISGWEEAARKHVDDHASAVLAKVEESTSAWLSQWDELESILRRRKG
jgi:GTP-binding protein EngB required for normal cell division